MTPDPGAEPAGDEREVAHAGRAGEPVGREWTVDAAEDGEWGGVWGSRRLRDRDRERLVQQRPAPLVGVRLQRFDKCAEAVCDMVQPRGSFSADIHVLVAQHYGSTISADV
jgi:hypothetical protein